MKQLLIALSCATLVLSGCGVFRSHHAWKEAKQEAPLELPPGLDQPPTTDALAIPASSDGARANRTARNVPDQPPRRGAQQTQGAGSGQQTSAQSPRSGQPPQQPVDQARQKARAGAASVNATRMHVANDVDRAYKRVGLALKQGGTLTVTNQDTDAHSYQIKVASTPGGTDSSGGGFMQKHLTNLQTPADDNGSDQAANDGVESGDTVTLTVNPVDNGGSRIEARGDPQKASRVISALKSRLGD